MRIINYTKFYHCLCKNEYSGVLAAFSHDVLKSMCTCNNAGQINNLAPKAKASLERSLIVYSVVTF